MQLRRLLRPLQLLPPSPHATRSLSTLVPPPSALPGETASTNPNPPPPASSTSRSHPAYTDRPFGTESEKDVAADLSEEDPKEKLQPSKKAAMLWTQTKKTEKQKIEESGDIR